MSLRDGVLVALRSAGSAGVSGEAIARDLGVSRTAVAKHIAALRELGYGIAAHLGEGYVLETAPDIVVPAEVAPLVTDSLWVRFEGRESTGSTNDDARELARAGAAEGTVVLTSRQTSGRGRMGRTWASPAGGAYLSAILRPDVAVVELAPLPLVVAIGVARGLAVLGARPSLKWPNDIELDGRKVAGVLLEMSAQADRCEWVVAGVGVNVTGDPGQPRAVALSEMVPTATAARTAAAVLDGIASAYRQWRSKGFTDLELEFEGLHHLQGQHAVVRDTAGVVVAEGDVEGVDELGRLQLRWGDTVRPVSSGDVTLR